MDKFERLRALEKKWRGIGDAKHSKAEGPFAVESSKIANLCEGDLCHQMADELATLIAELGQEVGAVADEVPIPLGALCTLLMCSDPWPIPDLGLGDSRDAVVAYVDNLAASAGFQDWIDAYHSVRQDYTSPAHTSEARDAARYRALKTHFQAKFHRATCDYWVIVGELKTDPRFIGEDGEQLTLDNALDAAIAAMRQEAGDA